MVSLRLFSGLALILVQISCVRASTTPLKVASFEAPPVVTPDVEPTPDTRSPELKVIKAEEATLGSVELDEALKFTSKGKRSYLEGRYDDAERFLKDALLLYPFLPEARLLLAKVLLVRGAAGRDLATLKLAKLMLEMALAMQPDLQEATQLLELFRNELSLAQ